ncbi:Cytochrome P450 86B1 [Senna tora]|uniref:Cytochrome P450 86B1 n=1 Tax=Senna tora TaxID=362788 RepID=A0A835C9T2_9FABA|nr:Cytochrome P450 86B1 [Senna tora]
MLWPLLGILPSLFFHINHIYEWGTQCLIQAGGTFHFKGVCIGRAHGIMTSNPSNIEYMLSTNCTNFHKGHSYRERFHDLLGNGIFNSEGESWKIQRRLALSEMYSTAFSHHSFETMTTLVHHKLLKLLQHKLVNSGNTPFDLQDILLRFTFDNISIAAMGVDPGCLAIDLPQIPLAKAFEEATELTLFRFLLPPFVWKPLRFLGLGYEKRLRRAIRLVHDFADEIVADRSRELEDRGNLENFSDLLSKSLENHHHHQNPHVSHRDFFVSFILAGRDTSSIALAWFFWLIHTNPQVQNRILTELTDIRNDGDDDEGKDPRNDVVFSEEELKRMVYLQAAISESLRLYPPVPIDFKQVIEDDVFPDGTGVKKGGWVIYSIYSMARLESIWGKDCLEFKPERWIKDGKLVSDHSQFKFPVFNAGPRLCVGKKFAYMQMKMVAAAILLRYEVGVVDGHEVAPKFTTTLYMKNGLLVTLKPRFLSLA